MPGNCRPGAASPLTTFSVYRWVQRFTPEFIEAARPCRHAPGDRWFVGETYLKVAGTWTYLYRAVDQDGQVVDVLPSARRDLAAAQRFSLTRCVSARFRHTNMITRRLPTPNPNRATSMSSRRSQPEVRLPYQIVLIAGFGL